MTIIKTWTEFRKPNSHLGHDKQSQTIIYAPIYKMVFWFHGRAVKIRKIAMMGWKIWFCEFWPTWRTQPSLWWSDALHMEHSHGAYTQNIHLYYLAHSSGRGPSFYPQSYKEKKVPSSLTVFVGCNVKQNHSLQDLLSNFPVVVNSE